MFAQIYLFGVNIALYHMISQVSQDITGIPQDITGYHSISRVSSTFRLRDMLYTCSCELFATGSL